MAGTLLQAISQKQHQCASSQLVADEAVLAYEHLARNCFNT